MGAHTVPIESAQLAGLVLNPIKVDNGSAGKKPTLTFTVKDKAGNGLPIASVSRLSAVLAGPTIDYGYTNFGSDVTTFGYVSETPSATNTSCSNDGTCSYTFTHGIPANAKGTYSIGMEGRQSQVINAGTTKETTVQYGADNKVINFSVDGSPIFTRRAVVSLSTCNQCHSRLSLHGENRNQIEQCVLCHNPSMDDSPVRSTATDASMRGLPPQGINFALLIHNIHTGDNLSAQNRNFVVIGNGGSVNDFGANFDSTGSGVLYPSMSPAGGVGNTQACHMCHVNNSMQLPLQGNLNQVSNPAGPITKMGPTTAACTACHGTPSAISHAALQTSGTYGESCDVCHGTGAEFDVSQVHAQ
jgi:OmcA/MtrC family decaheme c-type cytochrome